MEVAINIREELISLIRQMEEGKLRALLTLLRPNKDDVVLVYTDEMKEEIRERTAEYEEDGNAIPWEEVRAGLHKKIQSYK